MADIQDIKRSVDIVEVISGYVTLKPRGREMVGICPFHGDREPSLQVNQRKQIFKCFVCGEGGDVFDFLMASGKSLGEAKKILQGESIVVSSDEMRRNAVKAKETLVEWKQIKPIPEQAPAPDFNHPYFGAPAAKWIYRDLNGDDLGYIIRWNTPNGRKEIRQLTYCTDGKRYEWRFRGFDRPRPLYNLHLLNYKPQHKVLLVEGEKSADAGERIFNGRIIVSTWQGGADGVQHADFEPLRGRVVYLWPDNDKLHTYPESHPKAGQIKPFHEQPGNKAMLAIAEKLKGIAAAVKWINNEDSLPDKWDIADSDWNTKQATDYLLAHLVDVPIIPEEKVEAKPKVKTPDPKSQPQGPGPVPPVNKRKGADWPFRVLGFEKQESGPHRYYFYNNTNNTVVGLRPDQMKEVNLTTIAPLSWWEDKFPKKDGVDVKAVVSALTEMCHQHGVINFSDFRGRGAWTDRGRVVIHAGSHLIVDGVKMRFNEFASNHIYEQAKPLDIDLAKPLPQSDASKLLEICRMLNWERPANAVLLAGWCVVAPICGALRWRPHIWITGPAGSGKSTVLTDIVRALIENVALVFQGKTTEPGIRQSLRNDAVPVLFDEADVDGRSDIERIQAILTLMRASSTSDGGILAKGTAGQTAKTFSAKACFAFASIAVQVSQQSDRSRVTVLGLKPNPNEPEKYEQLVRAISETISPEFAKALQARSIRLIPVIIKNANTFAKAAAIEIGQQRTGDQLGAMLAGAYALEHDGEISIDEAKEYIRSFDWSEERSLESTRDEIALLAHIMEHTLQVESGGGRVDRNIGELVAIAAGHIQSGDIENKIANDRLRRVGIKVDGSWVYISNSSTHVKRILENTAWARNHNKILMRIDGAIAEDSTKFTSEIRTRAVKLPLSLISTPQPFTPKLFDDKLVTDDEPF